MRINGENYKSLTFTVLKKKLLSKEKKQTYRMLYIPTYRIGETIALSFKDKETDLKEFLYLVKITEIIPKQVKDLTLEDAKLDGFENVAEFQECVMDLNHKQMDNWGFLIRWDDKE